VLLLAVAVGIVVAAISGYFLIKGFRTGVMESKFGSFSRVTQPIRFWLMAAVHGFFALVMCGAFGVVLLGMLDHRSMN
jgi:hypothetical protein